MYRWLFFAGLVLGVLQLNAQDFPVTGTVTSAEDGIPIAGVTVHLKGISFGTITDSLGRYQISVPDRNSTLIFSAVGMVTSEVVLLKNQHQLDVQLRAYVSD